MAFKKTEYVDQDAKGKAISYDLRTIWKSAGLNVKGMEARLAAYKSKRQEMNALLDALLADTEQGMAKAGTLDDTMALAPWFNYGNENVVRVVGDRHGQPKGKSAPSSNAISNAAMLFANAQPQSRLIRNGK